MSETDELQVSENRGIVIQAAVLHLIDGRRHRIVLSEMTMDLEDPQILKYVKRYVTRCQNDLRSKPGTFLEDSAFRNETEKYFQRKTSFPAYTGEVLRPLISYCEHDEARSFAVLAADYRDDDVPYVLFVLLEEQETVICSTDADTGNIVNSVRFSGTSLPPVAKPVSSYACIGLLDESIRFADDTKWKDGRNVIRDVLLEAGSGVSKKEIVETVKSIACEVAEEFSENTTAVLSQVKNYISDTVGEGMALNTRTLAEEVFEDSPAMAESFLRRAQEKTLPDEVELPKAPVRASMRKQRIATDTGIEITFPAEYFSDSRLIDFVDHEDGTITIEIRQIHKITNRM